MTRGGLGAGQGETGPCWVLSPPGAKLEGSGTRQGAYLKVGTKATDLGLCLQGGRAGAGGREPSRGWVGPGKSQGPGVLAVPAGSTVRTHSAGAAGAHPWGLQPAAAPSSLPHWAPSQAVPPAPPPWTPGGLGSDRAAGAPSMAGPARMGAAASWPWPDTPGAGGSGRPGRGGGQLSCCSVIPI